MDAAPQDAPRVLVLYAHPAPHKSRVGRRLAAAARALPGVTLHDLYERYPDLDIDVRAEQELLVAHACVVFQHPLYWYSTPAILKEWQDLVLEHGWAYGRGGTALAGKRFLSAVSAGGPATSYARAGSNRHTLRELLAPIEQTARLCGMEWLPPFAVHGAHSLEEAQIEAQAARYARALAALRDGDDAALGRALEGS